MATRKPDFPHTRKAYAAYQKGEKRREKLMDDVCDDEDMAAWKALEKAEWAKVQEAFYKDTKKVNSREKCDLVNGVSIRRFLRLAPETPGETDWRKLPEKVPS